MFIAMIPTCVVCPLWRNNENTIPFTRVAIINGNPQGF
jgi:hypothetical protein